MDMNPAYQGGFQYEPRFRPRNCRSRSRLYHRYYRDTFPLDARLLTSWDGFSYCKHSKYQATVWAASTPAALFSLRYIVFACPPEQEPIITSHDFD